MKLSLCFVFPSFGDYHIDRMRALSVALRNLDIALHVLVLSRKHLVYEHRALGVEQIDGLFSLKYIAEEAIGRKAIVSILDLLSELKSIGPEWVFTIGYSGTLPLSVRLYGCISGYKTFFCADSKFDDGRRRPLREFIKSIVVRSFDGALVAGERHASYFEFLGIPKERIALGYDVIDGVKFFGGSQRAETLPVAGDGYILCVSRLIQRKRVLELVEEYSRSLARQRGIQLVIVGNGPLQQQLNDLIERLKLTDIVIHVESVPNSSMPSLYEQARITVLVSEYDQWGLCLNESLACGTPVACTDRCGAAGELVANGVGGIVIGSSVREIAYLLDLISDDEIITKLALGASKAITRWPISRFSDGIVFLIGR